MSTSPDVIGVYVLLGGLVAGMILVIAALIHYLLRLWKLRHHVVLKKRRVIICIHYIICLLFVELVTVLSVTVNTNVIDINVDSGYEVWHFFSTLLFWFVLTSSSSLNAVKGYLIWYDINWLSASQNERWHMIIASDSNENNNKKTKLNSNNNNNHNHVDGHAKQNSSGSSIGRISGKYSISIKTGILRMDRDHAWFIRNKYRFGNQFNVLLICYGYSFFCGLVISTMTATMNITSVGEYLVYIGVSVLQLQVPLCIRVWIYYQFKYKLEFEDNFFIARESLEEFKMLVIIYMLLFTFVAVFVVDASSDTNSISPISYAYWNILLVASVTIGAPVAYLRRIRWLLKMISPLLNDQSYYKNHLRKKAIKKQNRNSKKISIKISKNSKNNGKRNNILQPDFSDVLKKGKTRLELESATEAMLSVSLLESTNSSISSSPKSSGVSDNNSIMNDGSVNSYDSHDQEVHLNDVLSHSQGVNLFMHHLCCEFSTECLLSLIEFIQYQDYILEMYLTDLDKHSDEYKKKILSIRLNVELPSSVPKSSIVYGTHGCVSIVKSVSKLGSFRTMRSTRRLTKFVSDNNMGYVDIDMDGNSINEIRYKCYLLYKKYIALSSEFEINISSRTRRWFINRMDNLNEWMMQDNDKLNKLNKNKDKNEENQVLATEEKDKDKDKEKETLIDLCFIFNQCANEMYRLMQGSFSRFKDSNQSKKLTSFIFVR